MHIIIAKGPSIALFTPAVFASSEMNKRQPHSEAAVAHRSHSYPLCVFEYKTQLAQ